MNHENKQMETDKFDIQQLVTIPEDIEKIRTGKKRLIRRNDRYADEGEQLKLSGRTFIVNHVYEQKLRDVTEEQAKQEGYRSLNEYKEGITSIHHSVVWDPEQTIWAHELVEKKNEG